MKHEMDEHVMVRNPQEDSYDCCCGFKVTGEQLWVMMHTLGLRWPTCVACKAERAAKRAEATA